MGEGEDGLKHMMHGAMGTELIDSGLNAVQRQSEQAAHKRGHMQELRFVSLHGSVQIAEQNEAGVSCKVVSSGRGHALGGPAVHSGVHEFTFTLDSMYYCPLLCTS